MGFFFWVVCGWVLKLRTGVASDGSVRDDGMFERVDVRSRWLRIDARPMAASKQETSAALLDQSARQPAQQEEFARIRVADLGVTKEDPTIVLRHFLCFFVFFFFISKSVFFFPEDFWIC